jgi:4'-phosphopantetheinyl transferase EntD
MIGELLPSCVASVEALHDGIEASLFPEEKASIAQAVPKRRNEFATARFCARKALGELGLSPVAIPSGERGQPQWPAGVVGSITHCQGYRAAAVAHQREMLTLGIDAEPNTPLPDGLLRDIARPEEIPRLQKLYGLGGAVHWDRLLFSAKESVYKAWFPLAKRWLGFEDATLELDPFTGTFLATLLVEGPRLGDTSLAGFSGSWAVSEGLILTAIAMAPLEVPPAPERA